jgi:hypothetical protein
MWFFVVFILFSDVDNTSFSRREKKDKKGAKLSKLLFFLHLGNS